MKADAGHDKTRRRVIMQTLGGAGALMVGSTPASLQAAVAAEPPADCEPLLAHALRPLVGGETRPLCERYAGHVLLVVNTASKCGFTPQFDALEQLSNRYAGRDFQVLGFPSDDFNQELDDEAEVAAFCELNYGVTFPMFQKIQVKGDSAHPLYQDLAAASDGFPRWNFNKYLIDRNGQVIQRFDAHELPLGDRLVGAIEAAL